LAVDICAFGLNGAVGSKASAERLGPKIRVWGRDAADWQRKAAQAGVSTHRMELG